MLPYLTVSFNRLCAALSWHQLARPPDPAPADLGSLTQPTAPLPAWVAADPVVQKYRALLGNLPWNQFPERPNPLLS